MDSSNSRQGPKLGFCNHGNEASGSMGEAASLFIEPLNEYSGVC